MPMVAMFIIFDFVIKNPLHPETKTNLSFLDIVAAHFARLDLASEGTLHDTKVSEFTSIARLYVNSFTKDLANNHNRATLNDAMNMSPKQNSNNGINLQQPASLTQQTSNDVLDSGNTDMVSGYFHLTIPLFSFLSCFYLYLTSTLFSIHHHQLIICVRTVTWAVVISQQRPITTSLISRTNAPPCICLYRSLGMI